ncbi:MAG: hypothetical protein HQL32_16300 [Planctomycetes bacterium]|nr:hypothetical protein [Planctomycetota bacterium]
MMKGFIKKSLLFVAGLFLVDTLLYVLLLTACSYFYPNDYAQARLYPDSDMLILGTSHAGEGFDPAVIKKVMGQEAYNLGRARRNVEYGYYLSRYLVKQKRKVKTVVFGVNYHDFAEHTRPYMIFPFLEHDSERAHEAWELFRQRSLVPGRNFFLCDRYSADIRMVLSRSIAWLKNQKREAPFTFTNDRGFNASHGKIKDVGDSEHFATFAFKKESSKVEALKRTIKLWRNEGVKVYLIDPPEFIGTRMSRPEYDQFAKFMSDLAFECDATFKSFNLPHNPLMQKSELFKDGGWGHPNSHLNRQGAALFSEEFSLWLLDQE